MEKARHMPRLALLFLLAATLTRAQTPSTVDVSTRLAFPKSNASHASPSAVVWLKPLQDTPPAPFLPEQHYTLLQKNRMFKPHVLIIPVGSVVIDPWRLFTATEGVEVIAYGNSRPRRRS